MAGGVTGRVENSGENSIYPLKGLRLFSEIYLFVFMLKTEGIILAKDNIIITPKIKHFLDFLFNNIIIPLVLFFYDLNATVVNYNYFCYKFKLTNVTITFNILII